MLQYELRIQRLWKCPKCGRTVRTRGGVASRSCTCSEPAPFMELIDMLPTPAFDASAFTTYDNEVDSAPTERELVEELPAHLMPPPIDTENVKPTFRRGTGYLRAEASSDDASTEPSTEVDAFGAGIEPDNTTADAAAPVEALESQQTSASAGVAEPAKDASDVKTEGNDDTSRGRKRRRRRRRKPRDERSASREPSDSASGAEVSLPPTEQPATPSPSAEESTAPTSALNSEAADQPSEATAGDKESSGDAPKRKRRRRRRRGGK